MSSAPLIKALGLNKSQNPLEAPPGSLIEASNCIIKRSDIIESRRGYKVYDNGFGSSSDRAKQLMIYRDRIMVHYSNKVAFDNGTTSSSLANFSDFSGSYMETQTGLRIKSIESNGNFYFTTSDGIKKLSAASANDFSTSSGFITQAGGIKALDFTGKAVYVPGNITSWFTQDAAVAYRVVWGTKDANNNLILGTPSQRTEVYNALTTMLINDFTICLGALDNISASMINDANYVSTLKLPISATGYEIYTNLLALVNKLDTDISFVGNIGDPLSISSIAAGLDSFTITFTTDPSTYLVQGNHINLIGFTNTGVQNVNGDRVLGTVDGGAKTAVVLCTGVINADTIGFVSGKINSYDFNTIDKPAAPSTPATNDDLVELQTYLSDIFSRLQLEPTGVISNALLTQYITPLTITSTATVELTVTIPDSVTDAYFIQVYRSPQSIATGTSVFPTDVAPSDELQLVYEAYPTSAEITAGEMVIEDITPDSFMGAYLYTNAATGEGILQANDVPPLATDINRFKNVTFYANTKTKQFSLLSLLGVSNIIADYNAGRHPTITIANKSGSSSTYKFVLGAQQETRITTVADVAGSLGGTYFTVNSASDSSEYYVWYNTGASTDPAISGKTGIEVSITAGDSAATVATKTANKLSQYPGDFIIYGPSEAVPGFTANSTSQLVILNTDEGYSTSSSVGTSTFTIAILASGQGERASDNSVLLSSLVSPSQAVDQTARSLVRIINKDDTSSIYAYYLSGASDVPGKMQFEVRALNTPVFYLVASGSNVGSSFNPDISPTLTISSIGAGTTTTINTTTPHGLSNLDYVTITNTDSTPSVDGVYQITYIDTDSFSISVVTTVGGTRGALIKDTDSIFSDNDDKPNRIYYSKLNQPEAVPLTNYFDVGAQDKAILRIIPLRDTLFVFKEDGLFRISGEIAPFSLSLFDTSCVLLAPDSVSVANNVVYGWTNQGISLITESGVSTASRPIDTDILRVASSAFTNFKTATWGVGYDADNSYTVYTVVDSSDMVAQIAYRYSNLTNAWTTFDLSKNCGLINLSDNRQYLGATDINSIEQERKLFDRTDYADREYTLSLAINNFFGTRLKFFDVSNITVGDVVIQYQTVTVYNFNSLLKKLDIDPGCGLHDYLTDLEAAAGQDMRANILALSLKLDTDPNFQFTNYNALVSTKSGSISAISAANPTVITTSAPHGLISGRKIVLSSSDSIPSIDGNYIVTVIDSTHFSIPVSVLTPGTTGAWVTFDSDFTDMKTCFNALVTNLNLDSGPSFSNYKTITETTAVEAIVTSVEKLTKYITVNVALDYIVGDMVQYKSINSRFTYAPNHFGDPLSFKHFREATIMFLSKAFTTATASFSTDLLPQAVPVVFNGDGNGIFGSGTFGEGFFGGASHSAPFRTYVPRNCQRCRYIVLSFSHSVAREQYGVTGITLTGEIYSTRAYR